MKKAIKWFTFIELIVIASIIWILWFFSLNSMIDFLKNREFSNKINTLENIIKSQDLKINKKEIFDYNIIFEKEKNYFIINENEAWLWKKIFFHDISNSDNKIYFKTEENFKKENEKIISIVYKNWIFQEKEDKNLENLNFNFEKNNNYDFIFKTSKWDLLNNISIKNYDLEEDISLKNISDSKEKTKIFENIKIENIAWRKKINWNQAKKIYLFFEDTNWKEFYFLIKN